MNQFTQTAADNFKLWNDTLQTKDAAKVAELYAEDNTFLPTLSGDFKKGRKGAEEYFHHFLEKDPYGEIVDSEVQVISDKSYLHSGMYNFTVGPKDARQVVAARFTYVWKQNDQGKWEIIHHHSSVKPQ